MDLNRVLVISNEAFSFESSNGRTLGLLFSRFNHSDIGQIYTNNSCLDMYDCRYFQFGASDMVKSIFSFGKIGGHERYFSGVTTHSRPSKKNFVKTPFLFLLREFLGLSFFCQKNVIAWGKQFRPTVIVLQVGTCGFLFKLARKLQKQTNSKLIIYTTENYFFKNYNFLRRGHSAFFKFYKKLYNKQVITTFKKANLCIANSLSLANLYKNRFRVETFPILNSSTFTPLNEPNLKLDGDFIYFGNLSNGRFDSLEILAREIKLIFPLKKLLVFGTIPENLRKRGGFVQDNILLCDFLPYEKLLLRIREAFCVIHAESFDNFFEKDLRFAFSTKIADCLACGKPFLFFGPNDSAEFEYLRDNHCAFLAGSEAQLGECLKTMKDPQRAREVVVVSLEVARNYHCLQKNSSIFKNAIEEALIK